MRPAVLCTLLFVLPEVHAQAPEREKEAVALLEQAVAAQGKLPAEGIKDIQIVFEGQVHEKSHGTHSVTRTYWFRGEDRSFRVQTAPNMDKERITEHGVLGDSKARYWELIKSKRRELKPTNRTHLENILAIQRDRADFERIQRMVLLSRVDRNLARLRRGKPDRVTLENDRPNSPRYVFPKKLDGSGYVVLDLQRAGQDPLRLFINEKDRTVRKVMQFDRAAPDQLKFVYYLGAYRKNQGMLLPTYVSVHSEVPTEKTREKSTTLAGRLTMTLNAGLGDAVFAPKPKKPVKKP